MLTFAVLRRRHAHSWLTAALLFAITAYQVAAFADTFFGSYNLSSQNYGPYGGSIYGTNRAGPSFVQYVQAEQWSVVWDTNRANQIHADRTQVSTVFHVFKQDTSNCALPFDYDGVWESNALNAYVEAKNANCPGGSYGSYNNEARVWWPSSNLTAYTSYYGGVEFRVANGDLYTPYPGKVSNDIYLQGSWPWDVVKLQTYKTWCFDRYGSAYGC